MYAKHGTRIGKIIGHNVEARTYRVRWCDDGSVSDVPTIDVLKYASKPSA